MTDYFAPLSSNSRLGELLEIQKTMPVSSFPILLSNEKFQVDPVDRYTYIIMGLAVLIAIVVPLLNLS
jgi:hypothetical protein